MRHQNTADQKPLNNIAGHVRAQHIRYYTFERMTKPYNACNGLSIYAGPPICLFVEYNYMQCNAIWSKMFALVNAV